MQHYVKIFAQRHEICESVYKKSKNNGAKLPGDDANRQPRSQYCSPTLVLPFLGRTGLTFSNIAGRLVLLFLAVSFLLLFLNGSKTPAEIEHLGTNTVGMSKNAKAHQVLLGNQGDGCTIGLDSIEGALERIDHVYGRRKISTTQTEEDGEIYRSPLVDSAQQDLGRQLH